MKKSMKLFVLFLVLVTIVVGCGNNQESKYLVSISEKEFYEKIENKDTFILEVVQTGCSNCASFTPKYTAVLEEYKITSYSINISDIKDSKDKEKFLNEFEVDGTPTVIFFEDGVETSTMKRLTGDRDKDAIIAKLKVNGYIED